MPKYDRLARLLDSVYVLSIFVQLLLTVIAVIGCVLAVPRLQSRQELDGLPSLFLVAGWGGVL